MGKGKGNGEGGGRAFSLLILKNWRLGLGDPLKCVLAVNLCYEVAMWGDYKKVLQF